MRLPIFIAVCAALIAVPAFPAAAVATDLFAVDHVFQPPAGVDAPSNVGIPPARDGNQARLLINGEAAFQARLDLLDQAQRSIHVQVLIFKNDQVGGLIGRELIRRKQENPALDIRVIVDAYANIQDLDAQLLYFDMKNAGIEVEGFEAFYLHWLNEINLQDWTAGNKRYHEKYWIVDGNKAVVGGMNIGDEYARCTGDPVLTWRDQDVYLEGPVVADIDRIFGDNFNELKAIKAAMPEAANTDRYWEEWRKLNPQFRGVVDQSLGKAQEVLRKTETKGRDELWAQGAGWHKPLHEGVQVRVIRNRPREGETYIEQAYVVLIEQAKSSVLIENAYFVPTPAVQAALLDAARRGVQVTVIANSKETNDIPIITDAGRLCYRELIEAGAAVHEWHAERHGEGTVHSKFAVFDGEIALIGSYNLDPRSRGLNSENVVLIEHAGIAGELESHFRTEDLPWADAISLEQAKVWDDPTLLPDVRERPMVLTDVGYQRDLFEYYLIRQIQGSL